MLTVAVVGPLYFLFLRCRGYRLRDLDATRRHWAELRRRHPGPWLICGNHLTLIDSMLLTYGLMSLSSHFKEFRALPWNLPERANFQKQLWKGLLCYLAKCIPVSRGGDREEMQTTLGKCNWVLQNNRVLMIFPEGGRSRAGRIDVIESRTRIDRHAIIIQLDDRDSTRNRCGRVNYDRDRQIERASKVEVTLIVLGHHRDPMAHVPHHVQVVRDEQVRHSGELLDLEQQIENPLAKAILEGRFAAKDTIRVSCDPATGGIMRFAKV